MFTAICPLRKSMFVRFLWGEILSTAISKVIERGNPDSGSFPLILVVVVVSTASVIFDLVINN